MTEESKNKQPNPLTGTGRLIADGVIGITDIVESMHRTIATFGGVLAGDNLTRTKGVSGFVYQSIRTITGLIGNSLEGSLNQLSTLLENSESTTQREAIRAALNGVLGDYLTAVNNPLAIKMTLRYEGQPLTRDVLAQVVVDAPNGLLILVHGSSMNDLQWARDGHDHGAALARDLGLTPLYLHYNTGLHTSENGRLLSQLLQELVMLSPRPLDLTLFIVAHSMGGLVTRSACYYAQQLEHSWLNALKKAVFLGTPHHGALLEKGGNWIDNLLQISNYSAPFARLGKIRSSGVTDLRYGNVIDEDWNQQDRFKLSGDPRTPVPLPAGVLCYAIAGTTREEGSRVGDNLVGDGLVTLDSALGRHQLSQFDLHFPENRQWIGRGINHLDLLNHPDVYQTLRGWLASED